MITIAKQRRLLMVISPMLAELSLASSMEEKTKGHLDYDESAPRVKLPREAKHSPRLAVA